MELEGLLETAWNIVVRQGRPPIQSNASSSFKALAGRKRTVFLAFMVTASPVRGVRPVRLASLTTSKLHKPDKATQPTFSMSCLFGLKKIQAPLWPRFWCCGCEGLPHSATSRNK